LYHINPITAAALFPRLALHNRLGRIYLTKPGLALHNRKCRIYLTKPRLALPNRIRRIYLIKRCHLRQIPSAKTAKGPSRHLRAYQSTVTSARKGKGKQSGNGAHTQGVRKGKERRELAIDILEMRILGWTISFILDQVLPQLKLRSLREVTRWQPPTDLENRDSDSAQEPRSPEPVDPDLTCLPYSSKTQYHPCEAGRSYGTYQQKYEFDSYPSWGTRGMGGQIIKLDLL